MSKQRQSKLWENLASFDRRLSGLDLVSGKLLSAQVRKVVLKPFIFTLFSPRMSAPDARTRRKISLKPAKVLTGSYVV
jgi:hypothetical protein